MKQPSRATASFAGWYLTHFTATSKQLHTLPGHRKWLAVLPLLLALFFSQAAMSQQVVTVGTGTSASYLYGPTYIASATSTTKFSRHAYVYSAAEIAAAGGFPGNITKIAWNKISANSFTANDGSLTVYMKAVPFASHPASPVTWATDVAGATQVYSNTSQTFSTNTGWEEFNLNTPFYWNGKDNIEVLVEWSRVSNATGSITWEYSPVTETSATGSSTSALPATLTRGSNRPNVQLSISPITGQDAALTAITAPAITTVPGTQPIEVTLANYSASPLTSATVQWSVNGVRGTDYQWTGTLAPMASVPVTIASPNLQAGQNNIRAWITNPNNGTDQNNVNDTIQKIVLACVPYSGVLTINPALPVSATNFQSFTDAFNSMNRCGISGSITINVAPNSGPYTEQFVIDTIPGLNSGSIVVNGRGNTITFAPTVSSESHIIRFNGADNVTLDSLNLVIGSSATHGWAIHMFNDATGNVISNSTITLPDNSTSSNFIGIVASASTTSNATGGVTASNNIFMNNTIDGGYYAVRMNGTTGAVGAVGNQFISNNILNFYNYGIYLANTASSKIIGNDISRPTRSVVTSFYAIYFVTGSTNALVVNNRIHNPFGGALTSTSNAYGLYISSADATVGSENYFFNNLIYDFNGGGIQNAIYNSGSDGAHYYHNSISLDDQSAPTSTNPTRGLYQTTQADNIVFKNNIVSVTRGTSATAAKEAIFLNTAGTVFTSNNNVLYVNSPNGGNNIGNANGTAYATLADWQAAGFDSLSLSVDPMFTNLATGNLQPTNASIDNIGTPIAIVSEDITGASRNATTPDPGAYEFSTSGLDAAIVWVAPTSVPAAGNINIEVAVTNTRNTPITSLRLAYSDGATTQFQDFTGLNITIGNTQNFTFTTPYNLASFADLRAFIQQVNGGQDNSQLNDTTAVQSLCVALAGNYTINKNQPRTATNFPSFEAAKNALYGCGVTGAVTFTVAANSGPYTEQLVLTGNVPGISAANSITFKGNNQVLEYAGVSASRATVVLDGISHVTIDSLVINAIDNTYGYGVHITKGADSLTITNNTINISSTSTTESNSAGIVASNTNTSVTSTGNNANYLTISGNTISGGYVGLRLNGASATRGTANTISNNRVLNFYADGIFLSYLDSALVEGNEIARPSRSSSITTFTGITLSNSQKVTVSKNRIHTPSGAAVASNTFYGIYSTGDAAQGRENLVVNNLVYNVNSSSTVYGIYNTGADGVYYYHNTIVLDDPAMVSSSIARGFYQTTDASNIEVKNNIFSITRGGTGAKYALYFGAAGSSIVSNNNVFHINAPNANVGYFSVAKPTLADWQATNNGAYDQNSVAQDPQFVNAATGNFEPQNPLVNNIGAPVGVTEDIVGTSRSTTTPDPGAYEFTVLGRDVAIAWVAPVAPVNFGSQNITVNVTNILTTPVTSVTIAYTDGTVTETETFTGLSLGNLQSQNLTFAVPYNFTAPANLRAYVTLVNGSRDDDQNNDTTAVQNLCAAYTGNFTINAAQPTAGTNFNSFTAAFAALQGCGVSGPVTLTVVPNSGPYNEQLVLNSIPGANAANRVTVKGSNDTLMFKSTSANRYVIQMNGASYVTLDSLNIIASDSTYGWGIHLLNNANYNTISNSRIEIVSTSGTATNNAAIVASNSGSSFTGASNANYLTLENNTIIGGEAAIRIYGSTGGIESVGHRIINNRILDMYRYGVYLNDVDSVLVSGNEIARPTRTSLGAFYGITLADGTKNTVVEKNILHNTHTGNKAVNAAAYGLYSSSNDAPVGAVNVFRNNLLYNFDGSQNSFYAIYNSSSNGVRYYHNTVSLDDTATVSPSSATKRGFYQTTTASDIEFYNNVISVTGGTGAKHALYFGTAGSAITSNNNVLYVAGTNANIGYAGGASIPNFAGWQAASFDVNSVNVNPQFANPANGDFTPTNAAADNIGRPLASVTTDILGNTRSTTTPDAGAYEFTGVVGVAKPVAKAAAVTAWPNPFTNELRLQVEAEKSGVATIVLTDAVGRVVMSQQQTISAGANPLQLTVSENLPKGMYLLQVQLNGAVSVQKLVKQ
ncbi:MAG: right-handed parallel beta-helix repeat-containing protein [Hymenobacteraceae bacterium]|nr:right-handed parallel beta-helix repeat-containing protein [Hymenobacteraceae bacterium]